MTQFQNLWAKDSQKSNDQSAERSSGEQSEDATMKTAGKIASIAGHKLTREERKKAGPILHYGFGTAMGSLYGTLLEIGPRRMQRHALLSGIGFGSVLFAGADEIAVPKLGLSSPPEETPLPSHLYALASHIVYGLTTGAVRNAVRAAL